MLLDLLSRPCAYPYDLFDRFRPRNGWLWHVFIDLFLVVFAFFRLHFAVSEAMTKVFVHVHILVRISGSPSRPCHFHLLRVDLLHIPNARTFWATSLWRCQHRADFDLWILLLCYRSDDPSLSPWLRMKIGRRPHMDLKWCRVIGRLSS